MRPSEALASVTESRSLTTTAGLNVSSNSGSISARSAEPDPQPTIISRRPNGIAINRGIKETGFYCYVTEAARIGDPPPMLIKPARKYLDPLINLFVVILIISNLVAPKIVAIGSFRVSGALILFPITYIFGDV